MAVLGCFGSARAAELTADDIKSSSLYFLLDRRETDALQAWRRMINEQKPDAVHWALPISPELAGTLDSSIDSAFPAEKNYFYYAAKGWMNLNRGDRPRAKEFFLQGFDLAEKGAPKTSKAKIKLFKTHLYSITGDESRALEEAREHLQTIKSKYSLRMEDYESRNAIEREILFIYDSLGTPSARTAFLKDYLQIIGLPTEAYSSFINHVLYTAHDASLLAQAMIDLGTANRQSYRYFDRLIGEASSGMLDQFLALLRKSNTTDQDLLYCRLRRAIYERADRNLKNDVIRHLKAHAKGADENFLDLALNYLLTFDHHDDALATMSAIHAAEPENPEIRMTYAKTLFALAQDTVIREYFKPGATETAEDVDLYFKYLNYLLNRDDLDGYRIAVRKLMDRSLTPKVLEKLYRFSDSIEYLLHNLLRLGQTVQAIALIRRVAEQQDANSYSNLENAWMLLARHALEYGDTPMMANLRQIIQDIPQSNRAWRSDADESPDAGKLLEFYLTPDAAGLQTLEDALLRHPNKDELYQVYIHCFRSLSENARGSRFFDKLLRWYPFEDRPALWRGYLHLLNGDPVRAIEFFDASLAIDFSDGDQRGPDRLRIVRFYARALDMNQTNPEKSALFQRIAQAISLANHADRMAAEWDIPLAMATYEAALRIFPDAYCILIRLARQYMEMGNISKAGETYKRAFDLMPESFGRRISLCFGCESVFANRLFTEQAVQLYTEKLREHPDRAPLYYFRGKAFSELYDKETAAIADFETAVRLDTTYLQAFIDLAEVCRKLRLTDREGQARAEIIRLSPFEQDFHQSNAEYLIRTGRWDRIFSAFEVAFSENPELLTKTFATTQWTDRTSLHEMADIFSTRGILNLSFFQSREGFAATPVSRDREEWEKTAKSFANSSDPDVARSAAMALSMLGMPAPLGIAIPRGTPGSSPTLIMEKEIEDLIDKYGALNSYTHRNPDVYKIAKYGNAALPILNKRLGNQALSGTSRWLVEDAYLAIVSESDSPYALIRPIIERYDFAGKVVHELHIEEATPDLEQILNGIRSFAGYSERIRAAGTLKVRGVLPNLMKILKKTKTPTHELAQAVTAIGELGDTSLRPELEEVFLLLYARATDYNTGGVLELAEALHGYGDTTIARQLAVLLNRKKRFQPYFYRQVNELLVKLTDGYFRLAYESSDRDVQESYKYWKTFLRLDDLPDADTPAASTPTIDIRLTGPAPDFFGTDLNGRPVRLADFRGKSWVFLDFWATWCIPCLEEMPFVKSAQQTFKDRNVVFIGVNLDFNEKILRDYLAKNEIAAAIIFSGLEFDDPIARLYSVKSIPGNFLISPQGKIEAMNIRGEKLDAALREHVK